MSKMILSIGRHIVDIDGCLRSTNLRSIGPADIIALHGGLPEETLVGWQDGGDTVLLAQNERVPLDEHSVTFFTTARLPSLVRSAFRSAVFPASRFGEQAVSLAA